MEPYLAAGQLTVVYGKGGTLKSFVALDWAARVAAGGHEAVYVVSEGAAGIHARASAWMAASEVEALPTLRFMPASVPLHTDEAGRFIEAVSAQVSELPRLVVVDTLARNFVGGNENSPQEMGQFVNGVERLRAELGAAVLVVHHTTKDGTVERGTESLRNASFAMFRSTGQTLVCDRMKDGEPPGPAALQRQKVPLPHLGPDVTSLAVEAAGAGRPATKVDLLTDQIAELLAGEPELARRGKKSEVARRVGRSRDDKTFRTAFKRAQERRARAKAGYPKTASSPVLGEPEKEPGT